MNERGYGGNWTEVRAKAIEKAKPTLTEFLLARVAEDEHSANTWITVHGAPTAPEAGPDSDQVQAAVAVIVELQRRVLADCGAKRRIVEEHEQGEERAHGRVLGSGCLTCDFDQEMGFSADAGPCATLRHLALPYADHPDYREEWRP